MQPTKVRILSLLKRNDGTTVDHVAAALALAPMTVRQHLATLDRDGLVTTCEVRGATGRPHYEYRLTEAGHRSVADGHDRLLALLVEAAGSLDASVATGSPETRRAALFRHAAESLADNHAIELRTLPFNERIERVVAILRMYGGFAELQPAGGTIEIRDFGCVFRETVRKDGPCAWHEPLLTRALSVEIRPANGDAACAPCCRYILSPDAYEAHKDAS